MTKSMETSCQKRSSTGRGLRFPKGLEIPEGRESDRLELSAGAAVLEIVFHIIEHLGPIQLSDDKLQVLGAARLYRRW